MISVVIPAAGLFRHNEPLFVKLAAAKQSIPLEIIIPVYIEPSGRLAAWLSRSGISVRFAVINSETPRVGELFHHGTLLAGGAAVVWLHDDAIPQGPITTLFRSLTDFEPGQGVRVPRVLRSSNPDQAGSPAGDFTTQYIDRACLAFPRALYRKLKIDTSRFIMDGYQIEIQAAAAAEGLKTAVIRETIEHPGDSTLVNMPARDYAAAFLSDTKSLARALETHVESKSRPAISRIIPKGVTADIDHFFEASGFDVAEAVNAFDQTTFRYRGETYGRVTCGDRYSIPPILDVYDIALLEQMGIGDTMMHSAAAYHFKQLYPHVQFRVFCNRGVEYVASRLPAAFDQVIPVEKGEAIPATARVWNVANGIEGTGMFGFKQLGIENLVPIEARRMAPYTRKSIEYPALPGGPRRIGIQLNGGWHHKRYSRPDDLADAIADLGFTPIFFGTLEIPTAGRHARVRTATLDDLASCQLQLDGWIGFDSGASYIANSLGIPTCWIYSSHNPGGFIEALGAAGPYRTIWPGHPHKCAKLHGKTCRPDIGGAFFGWGICGLKWPEAGAACTDELDPAYLAQTVVELAKETRIV